MNGSELPSRIIQKFREERLSTVSSIISRASPILVEQRWDVLFQCSLDPKVEWIVPDLLETMLSVYHVPSYEQLIPKYLGDDDHWGAIVAPRVATTTGEPIAFIEHWFVTDPCDVANMVLTVSARWPLPCRGIWFPLCPQHRCAPFVKGWNKAGLQECVYVADWNRFNLEVTSSKEFSHLTCSTNENLDAWWPDFCRLVTRDGGTALRKSEMASLRKQMEFCQQDGCIINLYDNQGLAAHVSWLIGSEAELLIPQCWNVQYIFVRDNLRGQGVGRYLYGLASQNMALNDPSLVSARVQAESQGSVKALEAVGAERVLEYYAVE